MSDNNTSSDKPAKAAQTREDRLKAALKANLSRRKAQARKRAASGEARAESDETE